MRRDFTNIDDIAEGVIRVLDLPPAANPDFDKQAPDPASSWAPYRVFNIGNHQPVELMAYIEALSRPWARQRRRTSCPCRMATCRPRMPIRQSSTASPDLRRRRR